MRPLEVRRLGRLGYLEAVRLQEGLVAARRRGEQGDLLLLLEHEPVITVGRGGLVAPAAPGQPPPALPLPVVETSRGGQATYHGPGQLVAYPILDLRAWQRDLHWYLRQLEQVVIEALASYGLAATRRDGYTGVWVSERKIASIGVAVRGWITYHGVALNVDCEMSGFGLISPCGLPAEVMTSMAEQGRTVTVLEVLPAVEAAFRAVFGCAPSEGTTPPR